VLVKAGQIVAVDEVLASSIRPRWSQISSQAKAELINASTALEDLLESRSLIKLLRGRDSIAEAQTRAGHPVETSSLVIARPRRILRDAQTALD